MVGIFIFTMGFISVYALLLSTFGLNKYSQNSLVASHLAREGIELVRNVRDNNFAHTYLWNKRPNAGITDTFELDTPYTIENNLNPSIWGDGDVVLRPISDFWEWENEMMGKMAAYELCLTPENMYTHDCSTRVPWVKFWRYIVFTPVIDDTGTIEGAMKLTSKVMWYDSKYNEIRIDTVLTDFLRQ